MTYTIEVRGTQVTDWLFERAGWSFTVGRFHHPKDSSDALDMADRILGSWVWLPDGAAR